MKTWIFLIRADPACIAKIRPECQLLTEYVFPSPIRYEDLQEILQHASTAFGHAEDNTLPRGILCLYGESATSAPVPITQDTLKILCAILGGVETASDEKIRRHLPATAFKATNPIVIRMVLTMEQVLQERKPLDTLPSAPPTLSPPLYHYAPPETYEVYPPDHPLCEQTHVRTSYSSRPETDSSLAYARPSFRCNEPSGFESARPMSMMFPFLHQGEGAIRTHKTRSAPFIPSPASWTPLYNEDPLPNRPGNEISVTHIDSGIVMASKARRGVATIAAAGEQRCFEARGPRPLLQVLGVLERSSALSAEMFAALLLQFMPTIYQRVQKKVGKMNKSSLNSILSWFNPSSPPGMLEALSKCIAIMEQDTELSRHAAQLKDILDGRPGAPKIGALLVDWLRTFSEFPFPTQARILLSLAPHLLPVWRQALSWCSTTGPDDAEPGHVTLNEITHWGYDCASCGLRNIYGPRFRCDSCHNRAYDLCGPCHMRKFEVHEYSHVFRCLFRDVRHVQQHSPTSSAHEARKEAAILQTLACTRLTIN